MPHVAMLDLDAGNLGFLDGGIWDFGRSTSTPCREAKETGFCLAKISGEGLPTFVLPLRGTTLPVKRSKINAKSRRRALVDRKTDRSHRLTLGRGSVNRARPPPRPKIGIQAELGASRIWIPSRTLPAAPLLLWCGAV